MPNSVHQLLSEQGECWSVARQCLAEFVEQRRPA